MKLTSVALRLFLFLTLITGVAYPLLVTCVAKLLFPAKAKGSLVMRGDQVIGSELVGQKFEGSGYFWPRPSAVDYNPLPSGGSNLGPTSADLKAKFDERKTKYAAGGPSDAVPKDLLFASGSGLDPHISPQAARFQIDRVAAARNLSDTQRRALEKLAREATEDRQFGFLGEARINVLKLNRALDAGL